MKNGVFAFYWLDERLNKIELDKKFVRMLTSKKDSDYYLFLRKSSKISLDLKIHNLYKTPHTTHSTLPLLEGISSLLLAA